MNDKHWSVIAFQYFFFYLVTISKTKQKNIPQHTTLSLHINIPESFERPFSIPTTDLKLENNNQHTLQNVAVIYIEARLTFPHKRRKRPQA